jgi:hypothetical protein
MIEYIWIEQTVIIVTPIVLVVTEMMKKSLGGELIKKLLPLFTFPLAAWIVYLLFDLSTKDIMLNWFLVWLAANGMYDNIKFIFKLK